MAHHIQFGNMKVILVEPGNIKRMLMGKALSFPINRVLINGKQTDITKNVVFAYCPDVPRFVEKFKEINIGNITELGRLLEEARTWPEKIR